MERTRQNMKPLKNRVITTLSIAMLLTVSAFAATFIPAASAHTPSWTIPTFAYLTVTPNPIGVGQSAYVVMWLNQYPLSAGGDSGDRWQGFKVDVTAPDGTKSVLGPYVSDPIASAYTLFTPTQTGTYTFVFSWPGQVLKAAGYTGIIGPNSGSVYVNDTYSPSTSAPVTLTVQTAQVQQFQEYPLPTGYWQRPVEGQNTEWGNIASNWLSSPSIVGLWQPNGIAPNGAHIIWSKPLMPGGVVGSAEPYNPSAPNVDSSMTYYSGTQYENKFSNPIILNGVLFYGVPLHTSAKGGGTYAVDLQTGQTIWYQNISINYAQLYNYETGNQHGIVPGLLWSTGPYTGFGGGGGSLNAFSYPPNNGWLAFDPTTGLPLFNITGVPSGTQAYGSDGSIDIYRAVYDNSHRYVAMWNNTAAVQELAYPNGTGAWQWRPLNQPNRTIDGSNAYSWNVSTPWLMQGATIVKVIEGNMILGRNGTLPSVGAWQPYTMWAMSLKPGQIGQLLWMKNYDPLPDNKTIQQGPVDVQAGVFTMYVQQTMQWYGYSLQDGRLLWGPTDSEVPWDYYAGGGGAITSSTTAYGMLYSTGYGGVLYGFNSTTGKLQFTYGNGGVGNSTNAGFETAYGNYPLGIGAVADGKIYLYTAEHSENAPFYKGALLRSVDAITGRELWTTPFAGVSNSMAVADGYLIGINLYDMQIYAFGKGQTATTASGPTTAVPQGTPILVQGSITDQSPGVTTQTKRISPNSLGTPAISDVDQGNFMAYVYMQKPLPTTATGVPLTVTITAPDGTTKDIQTVSDANGAYAVSYTPTQQGIYKVNANFAGTNSYFNSFTETHVLVGTPAASAAPQETTTPTPTTAPTPTAVPTASPSTAPTPNTGSAVPTTTYIAISAVIVIAVVAAAAFILRRRK